MAPPALDHPSCVESQALSALPGVAHGFFGRRGGVSTGIYESLNAGPGSDDDAASVGENRRRIAAALGAEPHRLLSAYQVHSAKALVVERPWQGPPPRVDALVTKTPGLAVCALAADCAPVLLADAQAGVVAAAHAGWKGALAGVTDAAIEAMETLGAQAARIRAAVGPCISQAAYEVGPEYKEHFIGEDAAGEAFFAPGADDRSHFDLKGYVGHRLRSAGLGHVEILANCTCAEQDAWFSNRRRVHHGEADYGRNLSAILVDTNPS